MKTVRAAGVGREALVIGLGPSALALSAQKVSNAQTHANLDVFAMNAFSETELAKEVVPAYYVLTDPAFFGKSDANYLATSRVEPKQVWDYLRRNPSIRVVVPYEFDVPTGISDERVIYINTIGLQGFTRNIDPARARGYLSMTSYTSLALAGAMSYERILITGIENTQFKWLSLTDDRRVALRSYHSYDVHSSILKEVPLFRSGGVAAFFEDVSRLFGDLDLFSHLPIENLDLQTVVDSFPLAADAASSWLSAPSE